MEWLLAIPHYFVLFLFFIAVYVVLIIAFFAVLITGKSSREPARLRHRGDTLGFPRSSSST